MQTLQDITGCAPAQAGAALQVAGGCVQTAVEMLLEGVVFPEPAAAGGGPGPAPAQAAAVWEFDDGPSGWRPLAPETQATLEAAHTAGQAQVSFTFRRFAYQADLVGMRQTNLQTGMTRSLQRRGGGEAAGAGGAGGRGAKWGKGKKSKHSRRDGGGEAGGGDGSDLVGITYYDHTAEISSEEIRRQTRWKQLPSGSFDPSECDMITTEPFGSGPVVELKCSGSVRGARCVFRQDSIESALRSNHGRCPACKEAYAALAKGTQGSGEMSVRLNAGLQCTGFGEAGTFSIRYTFTDGIQSSLMAQPGKPYSGTTRGKLYSRNTTVVLKTRGLVTMGISLFQMPTTQTLPRDGKLSSCSGRRSCRVRASMSASHQRRAETGPRIQCYIKMDGFCIKNDGFFIQNDAFRKGLGHSSKIVAQRRSAEPWVAGRHVLAAPR